MSVVLTNMDMPNCCYQCRLKTRCEFGLANGWLGNKRDDNCPLRPNEEKREKGKWIVIGNEDDNGNVMCKCSLCFHSDIQAKNQKVPYCWWCGAEMEE